ncbi:MAG: YgfZ family protein [Acidimicrobiales bacterium]
MTTAILLDPATPYEWSRISARGAQAQSFLQGQLSQDVTDVGEHGVWSLLLTPTSEVITSALVRRDDHGYVLHVPRQLAEPALARLRRFLLRTDCQLELELSSSGPIATIGDQVRGAIPGPNEFAPGLTPHCFGSAFVASTVSFSKGCFTGQELVGRLDARGAVVPWRLVRCAGATLERVDEVLRAKGPEGPQGVTTAIEHDNGVLALGLVHRSALGDGALAQFSDVSVAEVA